MEKGREKKRDIHMVDRAPTAAPSNEGNVEALELLEIHFLPRVLISPNHHARFIAVNEQERFPGIMFSK
jgi:hypothetical protein